MDDLIRLGGGKDKFDMAGPSGLGREGFRTDMRKIVGGFVAPEGEIVSSKKGIQNRFLSKKLGLKDATRKYEEATRTGNRAQLEQAKKNLRIGHNLPARYSGSQFLWAAATNKYFAAILIPAPDEGKEYCDWVTDKLGWFYNPDDCEERLKNLVEISHKLLLKANTNE